MRWIDGSTSPAHKGAASMEQIFSVLHLLSTFIPRFTIFQILSLSRGLAIIYHPMENLLFYNILLLPGFRILMFEVGEDI